MRMQSVKVLYVSYTTSLLAGSGFPGCLFLLFIICFFSHKTLISEGGEKNHSLTELLTTYRHATSDEGSQADIGLRTMALH